MSLTAEDLKSRAQPLTNTDLEIKQGNLMIWPAFRGFINIFSRRATGFHRQEIFLY